MTPSDLERLEGLLREALSLLPSGAPRPVPGLELPYWSQRDNASGQGHRECFSSTCAMLARFHLGAEAMPSDDQYCRLRARHGDSTSVDAQLATLEELGLTPQWRTDMDLAQLREAVKRSPVAVGWFQHGPALDPRKEGGHWSLCIASNDQATVHHDPFGQCDVQAGGWLNANGSHVVYPHRHWVPRWEADGEATGWAIVC